MVKIIAIKVDDETWRKWKELNKMGNIATDSTREFINRMLKEYEWLFEEKERVFKERLKIINALLNPDKSEYPEMESE